MLRKGTAFDIWDSFVAEGSDESCGESEAHCCN